MFQRNNKNNLYQVYDQKPKKVTGKISQKITSKIMKQSTIPWAVIIGCIVFSILCVSITGIAIWYRNSMDASNKQQVLAKKIKQDMEKMSISGLTERYKPNDIDTIYSIEHIGPSRDNQLEQDENTTKLTIKYMVIKGLKNKDIESSINSKISKEMSKLYTNSEVNSSSIDYINISGNIAGNYANTISVNLIKYTKEKGEISGKKQGKSLNFDLTTGNEIKFDELFLPGISIKNVLSQVIYDNISQKSGTQNIEEKVYSLLDKYEQGEINEFYYDSNKICFVLDGAWYTFPMWKYYDKIGIYKRFKTDVSIFDGTHEKTGENFVFQEIKDDIINTKIQDNFIAIIITPYDLKNKSEYFMAKYRQYYDAVEQKIQELKRTAQDTPNQTIIYSCKIDLDDIEDYWSYFVTENDLQIAKKTEFLDECEICETASSETTIRILNEYFEKELLNKMYNRGYTLENLASMTKEELFSLVGNKAQLEGTSTEQAIIELVGNTSVEDAIEKQFNKAIDEIKELLPKVAQDEEINKLRIKINELKDNIDILEGKFAGEENAKIKSIDDNCKKEMETIENGIFNINLKREITAIFGDDIKKLDEEKNEDNMEKTEERAYYLLQRLNNYYAKNIYNDTEVNKLIADYTKTLISIQDWSIKLRQKKKEEERQNENDENMINNTVNTNTTNNNNTTNNTDRRSNNTNTNTRTNTTNNNNTSTPTPIPTPTPSPTPTYNIVNMLENVIMF